MNLLDNLNPAQREAVLTTEGPLLLLAGAGSGKTRVLTYRIAYLVEHGVDPFNIIAITFTNKAAREMRERVNSLVTEKDGVWVSTFHSACVRILRREIHKIDYDNNFTIYDADDAEKLLKSIIRELNINDKQFPAKAVASEISKQKDELISPGEYEKMSVNDYRAGVVAKIYKQYQKRLKENNALDFDDIIFKTVELFNSRPDVLYNYQERFKYIMVDEYQDTNTSQYTLVRLLSDRNKNICVVGDDDQSIYGWRGANIRNILEFEKDFPKAKTIKLEQNYRSTKNILNAANVVISNNISRKSKSLWTEHMDGTAIKVFKGTTDIDEAMFISNTIEKAKSEGASYSDFAVLYRTNAQSRSIEEALVYKNMPYRIFGGVRFYERREIKDVLAYLRSIYNLFDSVSLKRIINVPKRGIGDTTVEKISEYADLNEISFFDALKDADNIFDSATKNKKITEFASLIEKLRKLSFETNVAEFISVVIDETGYMMSLMKEKTDDAIDRAENVKELIAKAAEFEKEREEPRLAEFLEEVALVADIDNYKEGDETVVLMTMHSSKGLEFPTVFISGFEEGIFPSFRATISGDIKDLEEERRLCYVGITRARENLYLTMAKQRMQHGRIVYNAPSSFLKEIPEELLSNVFIANEKKKPEPKVEPVKQIGSIRSAISKTNKPVGFGGKSYSNMPIPAPKDVTLDFKIGDNVRQMKYGVGKVLAIEPAGADYEVTVEFAAAGTKKFMAHLSKLVKV